MRLLWKALPVVALALLTSCRSTSNSDLASETTIPQNYLALGDSITFGYNPLIPVTDANVAAKQFVGYPEVAAAKLGLNVANIGCTGETSGSLIDKTVRNNGCHGGDEQWDQHLKVQYSGNQLDYAVHFLKTHPDTKLVTITIGGNDILLVESDCNATKAPIVCKGAKVPGLIITLAKNLNKIIDTLQATGYKGPIVFLTQYARNYKDPIQVAALSAVQLEVQTIAKLERVKVASGYNAFKKASEAYDGDACKAGLMIKLPAGDCNQHPSEKGREILGQTVADLVKTLK